MELSSIAIPKVAFDPRLDGANLFADSFGALSQEEWTNTLIKSIENSTINGVEFPTFPPSETQNRIHGHDGATSLIEAGTFYKFACDNGIAGPTSPWFGSGYLLDFGSGWGRILRQFMRDFPLRNIVGFEPSGVFATVARANNPYVSFLSGGYLPDGILPEGRFNLAIGWSVYSHLSEMSATLWLTETARILAKGGAAMYTTWGLRFLQRLKAEEELMKNGEDIHWYSQVCLRGAGDINQRIDEYNSGKFVWFNSIDSDLYGEAFVSRKALENIIETRKLPLQVDVFDAETLGQDVFIVKRI
jgi:hypothetical protein